MVDSFDIRSVFNSSFFSGVEIRDVDEKSSVGVIVDGVVVENPLFSGVEIWDSVGDIVDVIVEVFVDEKPFFSGVEALDDDFDTILANPTISNGCRQVVDE